MSFFEVRDSLFGATFQNSILQVAEQFLSFFSLSSRHYISIKKEERDGTLLLGIEFFMQPKKYKLQIQWTSDLGLAVSFQDLTRDTRIVQKTRKYKNQGHG